jgi:hypothetical protein
MRAWLLILVPAPAWGAGYWLLERGASTYARGGANVAAPQDPIAIYTNPAALAGMAGLSLLADVQLGQDRRRFARAPGHRFAPVTNGWDGFAPSPGVFAVYGAEAFSLGAAVYGPPRVDVVFPADGAQRYSEIESRHVQLHYAFSAATTLPWRKLRIGATGLLTSQTVDTRVRLQAAFLENPERPEEPRYDAEVWLRATEHAIPGAILGLSLEPFAGWTFAGSYQLPYDVAAAGAAEIHLAEGFDGIAHIDGSEVTLHGPKMAPIARAAVRLANDVAEIELAGVWEGWSRNSAVVVDTSRLVVTSPWSDPKPIPNATLQTHMRDSFSLRLGGAWRVLPGMLELRAGSYFETSAYAPEYLSAGAFDLDKVGAAGGVRIDLPWSSWIDLGAGYVYWLPVVVADSAVTLRNALSGSVGPVIGNGRYQNNQAFLVVAVGVHIP